MLTVLDTMLNANAESIREYECSSCGTYHTQDDLDECEVNDRGEHYVVLVCHRCLKLGWDEWHR